MQTMSTRDPKGVKRMRRLNFLDDEPWDEVSDEARVRWFGHPFEADKLGASLWEFRLDRREARCTCTRPARARRDGR
jgi:hypothetical protein